MSVILEAPVILLIFVINFLSDGLYGASYWYFLKGEVVGS